MSGGHTLAGVFPALQNPRIWLMWSWQEMYWTWCGVICTVRGLRVSGLFLSRGFGRLPRGSVLYPRPSSVDVWDCASVPSPARLSWATRPSCDSPPRPLPGVSPSRRKACLLRWLVYCLHFTRSCSNKITHTLAPSCHTPQWLTLLANCPNGRRLLPDLHPIPRTHTSVQPVGLKSLGLARSESRSDQAPRSKALGLLICNLRVFWQKLCFYLLCLWLSVFSNIYTQSFLPSARYYGS